MQIRLVVLFALMVILPMLVFAWGEYSGHPGWAAPPMLLLSVVGTLLARRWPVAVLLLLPSVALAEQPSVIAPAPGGGAQAALVGWLVSTLGPVVLPVLVGLVFLLLGGLLHLVAVAISHIKAGRVRHYLLAITDGARQGVASVEQTIRPQLPDHLSPEEAQRLKDAAIKSALDYVKSFGLDAVKASLKLTDEQLLERLGVAVEAEVAASPSSAAEPTEAKGPADKVVTTTPSGRPLVTVAQPSPTP